MVNVLGLSHPEWEAKGSVVRLESHGSPLLQDGLMGCMQPLANSWGRIVIVVVVTRRRVVIVVVVDRLVGIIVLLLTEEVGVEVSVEVKMCLVINRQSGGLVRKCVW